MSVQPRPDPERSLARQVPYVVAAARAEVARFGHPEVEAEHLLLGLLATGGPSARALTGAGVDLAGLRRALVQLQEQDLASLGLPDAVPAPPPAGSARDVLDQHLPVSERAGELLEERGLGFRTDDRALLLALLEDGPRVRRLLQQAGVDPAALERGVRDGLHGGADAARPGRQQGQDEQPPADLDAADLDDADGAPLPPGSTRMQARHTQVLPVPRERVWALIASPQRRPEWDPNCAGVDVGADGTEEVTTTSPGDRERVAPQVVTRLVPGAEIAWAHHAPGTRPGRGAGSVDGGGSWTLHVRLEEHEQGCTIDLHKRWVTRGRSWKLLRPLLERTVTVQLRRTAVSIAQAASEPA
ncbi:SRPBCC domain-containing protein [Quadrisphaera sp. DSM 44207]|uniref:SRPBCC family protein n=1 Tax=Quadrisphaera sp. DSM 44207 TaxID=1881057 RepID=UPI00088FB758|nr:Clp protease N-terminal domain-containing protein [Quadrisphaera sp. DSM 44207]SDQ44551.1 Clp amino terminal domain-containing protein, pathogenicity island component [Quadrisphaera sp. DSM 44207]